MIEEFGGYLPFEVKDGNEYYFGEDVVALNCARNAIVYAFQDGGFAKMHVPFYMCITVMDALEKNGVPYELYHIDEEFEPINVQMKANECILYPNYFGLFSDKKIVDIVQKYENVILDNTQAFFAKPVMNAYNVYSCRKFIGVSDGAYVIHKGIKHVEYERDTSYQRMQYLFKCMEKGTNAAYGDNLLVEKKLCELPIMLMSSITHRLLGMADYPLIKERRISNFDYIDNFLKSKGEKSVTRGEECVPMVYPFMCDNLKIRDELIKNRIYIPQWWKYLLEKQGINSFEKKLVEHLVPLPIDQRYENADIKRMLKLLEGAFDK